MVNCPNLLVGALDNLGCACLCSNCVISAKYKSAFGTRNESTTSVTKTFFCFNYNFIDTIERSVAILQSTFFLCLCCFFSYIPRFLLLSLYLEKKKQKYMSSILIKAAHVVNEGKIEVLDVLVQQGRITKIAGQIDATADREINADG